MMDPEHYKYQFRNQSAREQRIKLRQMLFKSVLRTFDEFSILNPRTREERQEYIAKMQERINAVEALIPDADLARCIRLGIEKYHL